MKEIRLHGRGGQGAVTAAEMLARAFVDEGKLVASFPMFGTERRGAPVAAFLRFDDQPIREKTKIYYPDCLIVVDPPMRDWPTVYSGLRPGGVLILNSTVLPQGKPHENLQTVAMVDAMGVALQELGINAPNTCMMGAFAGATGWLKLESVLRRLADFFEGQKLARNIRCAERGFREVRVVDLGGK